MIRVEKRSIEDSAGHQNSDTRGNLLTAVMRASYSEEKKDIPTMSGAQNRKQAFTEEAVVGNLFISGMALKIFSFHYLFLFCHSSLYLHKACASWLKRRRPIDSDCMKNSLNMAI